MLSRDEQKRLSFHNVVAYLWRAGMLKLDLPFDAFQLTWTLAPNRSYPHFRKARGFAACFTDPEEQTAHILFAEKILHEGHGTVRGIVLHELGHALDFFIPPLFMEEMLGRPLPRTPERRADAIAEAVWAVEISYDAAGIQTITWGAGIRPRPHQLGL